MKEERLERMFRENLLNTPEALEALKIVQQHDYIVGVTSGCGFLIAILGVMWLIGKYT